MSINLAFLGFGLWMIGDGYPGVLNSVGGALKVAAGVIVIVAAFGLGF